MNRFTDNDTSRDSLLIQYADPFRWAACCRATGTIGLSLTTFIWVLFILAKPAFTQTGQLQAWLELRDGSLIKATVEDQTLPWLTVESDGSISESERQLSEIAELYLTDDTASDKIARIRRLIDQLAADDFRQRNLAEKTLLLEGGPFVELIQIAAKKNNEPEVRYRVDRILKDLISTDQVNIELDRLKTVSGMVEGDVRDWKLKGKIGSTSFELDRGHLRRIYFSNPLLDNLKYAEIPSQNFEARQFISKGEDFFTASQTHVNFDADKSGDRPSRNTVVHTLFSFQGCKLACENPGWEVIVSGFSFLEGLSKNNSVGNHYLDPATGKHSRYMGVMEITFCQPGRPEIPAAVGRAGCYLEIVVPRHTLLEAYNSAGHRIGMVEASTNRSSFVGLVSNEPIARLRAMPNYYLNMDQAPDGELNEDFAVDDLCFGDLTLVNDFSVSDRHKIIFKNGECLNCDGFKFSGDDINVIDERFGEAGLTFTRSDVVSIMGPRKLTERTFAGSTHVMLSDGSVVKVNSIDSTNCELEHFGTLPFADLSGFWSGNVAMYPDTTDLDNVRAVAVYPGRRFTARNFEIFDGKFTVSADSIEQLNQNAEIKIGVPDPQVDTDSEGLSFAFDAAPSVWFKSPAIVSSESGLLRLNDGQQFVLDGSAGFKLLATDDQTVTIGKGDKSQSFPISDIAVLRFAE